MPALGFLFTLLFWPYITSPASSPRWAMLAVVAPLALLFIPVRRVTLSHVLFIALLIYAAVTLLWVEVPVEWMANYAKLLIIFAIFLIGAEMKTLEPLVIGAAVGIGVNSAIVIAQCFRWNYFPQVAEPAGLFMNKNVGAEYGALLFVALIYYRRYWLAALAIPTVFFASAKGAMLSVVAVFVAALLRDRPRAFVLFTVLLSGALTVIYFNHFNPGIYERVAIWHDTYDGLRWFGRGFGSYYTTYPDMASHVDTLLARPEHAHNDLLEFAYEIGIGTVLVVAFVWSVWRADLPPEKAVLLAFGFAGLFAFPFHMPATAAFFALAAGRCAGVGPDLRDDIARGRAAVCVGVEFVRQFLRGSTVAGAGEPAVPTGVPNPKRPGVPVRSKSARAD